MLSHTRHYGPIDCECVYMGYTWAIGWSRSQVAPPITCYRHATMKGLGLQWVYTFVCIYGKTKCLNLRGVQSEGFHYIP